MAEPFKVADFVAQLNSVFRVTCPDAQVIELELIDAREGPKSEVQESFSVVFRAPRDAPQVPGLYSFEHEKMQPMQLGLSPFKMDQDGLYYEAIFSRLLKRPDAQ
jgi:hypothetical protein